MAYIVTGTWRSGCVGSSLSFDDRLGAGVSQGVEGDLDGLVAVSVRVPSIGSSESQDTTRTASGVADRVRDQVHVGKPMRRIGQV